MKTEEKEGFLVTYSCCVAKTCPIALDVRMRNELDPHHAELMIPNWRVRQRTNEMAQAWVTEYAREVVKTEQVIFMTVLSGGVTFAEMFLSAISKKTNSESFQKDYVRVGSYGKGMNSNNQPEITCVPKNIEAIKGAKVVLLEDIKDTGRSLKLLVEYFRSLGAKSVEIIALLAKTEMNEVEPDSDSEMVGFEIPSVFVVGEGIDWAENYRVRSGIWKIVQHKDGVIGDRRNASERLWEKVNIWIDRYLF